MQLQPRISAVQQWLLGLRLTTEPECTSVLQTKTIPLPPRQQQQQLQLQPQQLAVDRNVDICQSTLQAVEGAIEDIIHGAHASAKELLHLDRLLDKCSWKQVKGSTLNLTRRLRRRLRRWGAYLPTGVERPAATLAFRLRQDLMPLFDLCTQLTQVANQFPIDGEITASADGMQTLLDNVADKFASYIDSLLGMLVHSMVESINNIDLAQLSGMSAAVLIATPYRPLPIAVASAVVRIMGRLSLEGGRMCGLLCREGGIQVLMHKCCPLDMGRLGSGAPGRDGGISHLPADADRLAVWVQALRALSMICCIPETVLELQKIRGVEFLTSILCSSQGHVEEVRAEAAGVIAQITSPSLGCVRHLTSFLENMEDLIRSLTDLCNDASSSDTFLLGVAALANATFADPLSVEYMLRYGTLPVLTRALKSPRTNSLFAKDQVATVMANMATSTDCFEEIRLCGGIDLLVDFLSESICTENQSDGASTGDGSVAADQQRTATAAELSDVELAACERLQQKAAIALSRLSRDLYNVNFIIQSQGVSKLVQLCRDSKKRNHSGAVLVACLAALRKIASICSDVAPQLAGIGGRGRGFSDGGAGLTAGEFQLLVTPKLMDSYIMCCKLGEEYSV